MTRGDKLCQAQGISLKAVHNSTILTYSKRKHSLDIGLHRTFRWSFLVAEVSQPILEADFLRHFRALVELASSRLVETETSFIVPAQILTPALYSLIISRLSNRATNLTTFIPSSPEYLNPYP